MTDREGETTSIIISVKGGHVTSSQVRNVRGVIEREEVRKGPGNEKGAITQSF
jgi:hypothetical protein